LSGKDKIEISGDQPGMIYVAIEPYANLAADTPAPQSAPSYVGGNTGRNNGLCAVGAAVAPTKLGLSTPRPDDFDAFWDAKLAAQAKIPINPALTPVQTDVPGVELSMFVLDALGSKTHGYVAKPAREGKFPAHIQLQYAGVYALNAHAAAQRAADGWLFINVDSHNKLPSDPSGGVPGGLAVLGERHDEVQDATPSFRVRRQLEAEQIVRPTQFHHRRRVECEHLPLHGSLFRPPKVEAQGSTGRARTFDRRREPSREVFVLGQRAPDFLARMGQPASVAEDGDVTGSRTRAVLVFWPARLLSGVHSHDSPPVSSMISRCRSRALRCEAHRRR